jgi:hypothetical protein
MEEWACESHQRLSPIRPKPSKYQEISEGSSFQGKSPPHYRGSQLGSFSQQSAGLGVYDYHFSNHEGENGGYCSELLEVDPR